MTITHADHIAFADCRSKRLNQFAEAVCEWESDPLLRLLLRRRNGLLLSASTANLGGISPIALTDERRSSLITEFQVSWDAHVSAGCDFDCSGMTWPTP